MRASAGRAPLMDCWATAQMLPNLFRRLFAEGAFAQGFVPVFAAARATEGAEAADKMASQAMAFIITVVALVTIGIEVAMPWIMPFLLSAYIDDPHTLGTATLMAQLAMPYLVCMTLASLLSGVLNTLGRFALTAAAPILLNVCTHRAAAVIAPIANSRRRMGGGGGHRLGRAAVRAAVVGRAQAGRRPARRPSCAQAGRAAHAGHRRARRHRGRRAAGQHRW